jgi:Peptidase M50B-like
MRPAPGICPARHTAIPRGTAAVRASCPDSELSDTHLVTGGLIYLIARYRSGTADGVTAYGVAWFLLLSGIRVVFDHGVNAADAGNLARLTHIRPGFWVLVWMAGSIAGLIAGGALLV